MACGQAAPLGIRSGCEYIANGIKGLEISCGIRARSAADRSLIDENDLVQERITLDGFAEMLEIQAGAFGFDSSVKHVVDQRGFARAGDAGDGDHRAERKHDIDIAKVVSARAEDAQKTARRLAAQRRNGNAEFAAEITSGQRFG